MTVFGWVWQLVLWGVSNWFLFLCHSNHYNNQIQEDMSSQKSLFTVPTLCLQSVSTKRKAASADSSYVTFFPIKKNASKSIFYILRLYGIWDDWI